MTSEPWILCVDDDEMLLQGLELQLGFDYDVRTAIGGEIALEMLEATPDCAVVISDMRMPGMNGAQFLAKARTLVPDTTRMLLTGYSDVDSAISAINEGGIYRFMTKPAPAATLTAAIDDGIRQWELIRSERVLLEQTLVGATGAMIEALEIAQPDTFSRSRMLESASRHVATELGLEPVWEVALAGLLLRLGWIAVPGPLAERFMKGEAVTAAEGTVIQESFDLSVRLVGNIPRLEGVAGIIRDSHTAKSTINPAVVVRAVAEFDLRSRRRSSAALALKELREEYPERIIDALATWDGINIEVVIRDVTIAELLPGMVTEMDVTTTNGNVLVKAGTEITETVLQRLRNFAATQGVGEPITVACPTSS